MKVVIACEGNENLALLTSEPLSYLLWLSGMEAAKTPGRQAGAINGLVGIMACVETFYILLQSVSVRVLAAPADTGEL